MLIQKGLLIKTIVAGVSMIPVLLNAGVTINLGAEFLSDKNSALLGEGSLVQLIAQTNGTSAFSAPTPDSFTGSGEIIIGAFSFNNNTMPDGAGSFLTELTNINMSQLGVATGNSLLLRWWPTLTLSATTPGAGTYYGQISPDLAHLNGGDAWVLPIDGQFISLYFLTNSAGGSYAESAGMASLVTVPEPSTYAFGGLIALGAIVALRRMRRV